LSSLEKTRRNIQLYTGHFPINDTEEEVNKQGIRLTLVTHIRISYSNSRYAKNPVKHF